MTESRPGDVLWNQLTQLDPDELMMLIDLLFPGFDEELREDLCDSIILAQRKDEPGRSFRQFVKELDSEDE